MTDEPAEGAAEQPGLPVVIDTARPHQARVYDYWLGGKEWSIAPFADREVDGAGGARGDRDGDDLAVLAADHQGPLPALDAHRLDIGALDPETRSPFR